MSPLKPKQHKSIMNREGELVLLNAEKDSWIGIWLGTEGRVGEGFLGFHSIPIGSILLLRVAIDHSVLVLVDTPRVVLRRDSQTNAWSKVPADEPLHLPPDLSQRLIPCGVSDETKWSVGVRAVERLGLPLHHVLGSDELANIHPLVQPNLSQFKQHMEELSNVDDDDAEGEWKEDDQLAHFDLVFALMVCTYNAECFEVWRRMLRVLEMLATKGKLPARFVVAFARHLSHLPKDYIEDSDQLGKDLMRITVLMLDVTGQVKSLRRYYQVLLASAQVQFPNIDTVLSGHQDLDGEGADGPVIVETNTGVTQQPTTVATSSSAKASQAPLQRMEWML